MKKLYLIFVLITVSVFCKAEQSENTFDIYNLSLVSADIEYEFKCPKWTKSITIQCRSSASVRVSSKKGLVAGSSTIPEKEGRILGFGTIKPNGFFFDNPIMTKGTIYFASSTPNLEIEIWVWRQ